MQQQHMQGWNRPIVDAIKLSTAAMVHTAWQQDLKAFKGLLYVIPSSQQQQLSA